MNFQSTVKRFSSVDKLTVEELRGLDEELHWLNPDKACKYLHLDCERDWGAIQRLLEHDSRKDHYFRLWILFCLQGFCMRSPGEDDSDLSFDPESIPGAD